MRLLDTECDVCALSRHTRLSLLTALRRRFQARGPGRTTCGRGFSGPDSLAGEAEVRLLRGRSEPRGPFISGGLGLINRKTGVELLSPRPPGGSEWRASWSRARGRPRSPRPRPPSRQDTDTVRNLTLPISSRPRLGNLRRQKCPSHGAGAASAGNEKALQEPRAY